VLCQLLSAFKVWEVVATKRVWGNQNGSTKFPEFDKVQGHWPWALCFTAHMQVLCSTAHMQVQEHWPWALCFTAHMQVILLITHPLEINSLTSPGLARQNGHGGRQGIVVRQNRSPDDLRGFWSITLPSPGRHRWTFHLQTYVDKKGVDSMNLPLQV